MKHCSDPAREQRIRCENGVRLPMASVLQCPDILIKRGTRINGPINIRGSAPCKIGKFCAIGYHVHILTTDHKMSHANLQIALQRKHGFVSLVRDKGELVIGHNVWIADKVTLLPGVSVGNGAVIGAGSVVTKDVEPYAIVYGTPAQLLKKRFSDEIIRQLEIIRWWDWSDEQIERNETFFNVDLETVKQDLADFIIE